jgi:hypothetical protein
LTPAGIGGKPEGVRVFQIGTDYLLGRWRDELEVERVRAYELVKR